MTRAIGMDIRSREARGGNFPRAAGNSGWINPGSYLLMGQQRMANGPGGHAKVLGGTAILQKALVSGPGTKP